MARAHNLPVGMPIAALINNIKTPPVEAWEKILVESHIETPQPKASSAFFDFDKVVDVNKDLIK